MSYYGDNAATKGDKRCIPEHYNKVNTTRCTRRHHLLAQHHPSRALHRQQAACQETVHLGLVTRLSTSIDSSIPPGATPTKRSRQVQPLSPELSSTPGSMSTTCCGSCSTEPLVQRPQALSKQQSEQRENTPTHAHSQNAYPFYLHTCTDGRHRSCIPNSSFR